MKKDDTTNHEKTRTCDACGRVLKVFDGKSLICPVGHTKELKE